MAFLSTHDFVSLSLNHLEKNGSLSYIDLSNVNTFHYTILKKIHHYHSSERSLCIGKLSSSPWQIQVFQNSYFHLKAWILSLATKYIVTYCPWSDICLCSRKHLPQTQFWITIFVCQLLFQVKKNGSCSLVMHNSNNYTRAFS